MSIFNNYAEVKALDESGATHNLAEQVYAYAVTCFINQVEACRNLGGKDAVEFYNANRLRLERELQWQLDEGIAHIAVWSDKRGDAVLDITFDQCRLDAIIHLLS